MTSERSKRRDFLSLIFISKKKDQLYIKHLHLNKVVDISALYSKCNIFSILATCMSTHHKLFCFFPAWFSQEEKVLP